MYWADHPPPHLRAIYGGEEAQIEIEPVASWQARFRGGRCVWCGNGSPSESQLCWRIGAGPRILHLWSVLQDSTMQTLIKFREAKPLPGNRLALVFSDGASGVHDLSWLFANTGPMIEPLRDPAMFERVFLDHGALTWPNGFDLSPWSLRRRMQEAGELAAAAAE